MKKVSGGCRSLSRQWRTQKLFYQGPLSHITRSQSSFPAEGLPSFQPRSSQRCILLNHNFGLHFTVKKAHTASLVVSPGDTAEFDVFFHSNKIGRMTGTIHLSVINNQYEETMIHLVGESYEDDITLDNIHGLISSTSQESSDKSEVIEIAEESTMEDLVTGGRSAILTAVDSSHSLDQ
jgi:hypothetical protein